MKVQAWASLIIFIKDSHYRLLDRCIYKVILNPDWLVGASVYMFNLDSLTEE